MDNVLKINTIQDNQKKRQQKAMKKVSDWLSEITIINRNEKKIETDEIWSHRHISIQFLLIQRKKINENEDEIINDNHHHHHNHHECREPEKKELENKNSGVWVYGLDKLKNFFSISLN